MAKKKKSLYKRWKKNFIGREFNIWDVVFIALIIGSGYFIYYHYGWEGFLDQFASGIFYAVIIGFVINTVIRRASK